MLPLRNYLNSSVHIAPLAMFRAIFGIMMFGSVLRFMLNGWVYQQYIMPKYFFTFYGFEWVKPLGDIGMYIVFVLMAISAFMVMLGLWYRASIVTFFLLFTYVELLDITNYLNHYYFVSVVSFLMIFLPANKYFSLDIVKNPSLKVSHVPRWTILIIQLQLGIVYFYAGLAKLNYDWLFNAMPLRIWLPANAHLPLIGSLLDYVWVAYVFSWFGCIYDLSIPFLLINRRARSWAYFFVVAFHIMTAVMFPIGMFPYIMILSTLIFFSEEFHLRIIHFLRKIYPFKKISNKEETMSLSFKSFNLKVLVAIFAFHFILQLIIPFRFLLYPGELFWTEQGYRFSWRVMLMEKAGTAFFYVTDPETGRSGEVMLSDYLTPVQQKMLATQPDMILQFAHFLKSEYKKQGIKDPEIRVESYVTLNGCGTMPYIDKKIDLTKEKEGFHHKAWILPFTKEEGTIVAQ